MTDSEPKESQSKDGQQNVQHIADITGQWGPFQRRLMFLLIICYCASPFNNASLLYYVIKSDLWCEKSTGFRVAVKSETCSFKDLEKCSAWGHNITRTTVVKEWNLVCENYWQRSLALSAYQIGYLVSGPIVGKLSDKFGRKNAIIGCTISEIICSILLFFSSSIEMFVVVRFFHGIGGYGRYLASLVLLVESVGPKMRGRTVVRFDWIWFGGEYATILVSYFVTNFRYIYLGSAVFQTFCLTIIMPRINESLRWQLVNGQDERAEKVLRAYSVNQGKMDEDTFKVKYTSLRDNFKSSLASGASKETILSLYRHPTLLKYCCALYVMWFTMAFTLFGITYTSLDLSGNIFINNAIFAISGVTALIFMSWKVESFKRKPLILTLTTATSMCLFAIIPLATSSKDVVPRTILITIGKFFASCTFLLMYVYSPEVFPTSIRHLGVGTCSTAARVATITAPFVAQLTAKADLRYTFGLFSTLGLIGASVSFALPETKDKEIADTVEEMIRNTKKIEEKELIDKKNSQP